MDSEEREESEETRDAGKEERDEEQETEGAGEEEAQDVTQPGEWERKPADEEDLRHDDGTEPIAEPSDDAADDQAEREEGTVSEDEDEDEGFDRPDTTEDEGLEDTGGALEEHAEPFLQGPEVKTPVGAVPKRSLVAMGAFIVIFCAVFFGLWALLGNLGIFLGIFAGAALGLGAMKLLAERERTA